MLTYSIWSICISYIPQTQMRLCVGVQVEEEKRARRAAIKEEGAAVAVPVPGAQQEAEEEEEGDTQFTMIRKRLSGLVDDNLVFGSPTKYI